MKNCKDMSTSDLIKQITEDVEDAWPECECDDQTDLSGIPCIKCLWDELKTRIPT